MRLLAIVISIAMMIEFSVCVPTASASEAADSLLKADRELAAQSHAIWTS